MRRAPRAYLLALWWRLQGKRLRSRAHFAPLLGVSPRAYELWLRGEIQPGCDTYDDGCPSIIALITDGDDAEALDATLHSVASERLSAITISAGMTLAEAMAAKQIDWAAMPWFMPLTAGDILAAGAGGAYRAAIRQSDAQIIYADDDLIGLRKQRTKVHLKPDWNSELFRYFDYLTGACIVRAEADDIKRAGGPQWARELVVCALRSEVVPQHVQHVLHHRRSRPLPCVPAKPLATGTPPPVTVIVPTRNRLDLLSTCLDGVSRTDYPNLDVLVVDNDSDDPATLAYLQDLDPIRHRVLRHPGAFNFSAINNHAVREASGHLICLLNNDIEVVEPDWLMIMVSQAQRDDVGAVGARLLYPDGRIQHAGVVLGVGGGAAHAHRLLDPQEEGYFHRHDLPQFVSAVTAACLVVARERFLDVGGLDEQRFAVAFNDVDLCMRLNRRGWQSLYEPRATLIHHESVSRGLDRDPVGAARLAEELAALKGLWGTGDQVDPFHHPELSAFSERFVLKL